MKGQEHLQEKKEKGLGSVWTWTALDTDSRLIVTWLVCSCDVGSASEFMQDVAGRLRNRVQLTTDSHKPYLNAVEDAFGADIDYATLQKIYGREPTDEKRYSPACLGWKAQNVTGNPDSKHISTSYVERQNLTMRMMRRFTRLTNPFSKKVENHAAAVAPILHVYNFVRVHQTLRVMPAVGAGVTNHVWSIEEIVGLFGGAMNWNEIVQKVTPYVVKIETPNGHGTGFLCLYNHDRTFYGIATANHVVSHADEWQQPIRIHHHSSGTTAFLREHERVIFSDESRDSAVILTNTSELTFPEQLIPLLPVEHRLPIGVEVGWIGYPAVSRHTQCFFSGNVSAFQEFRHAYLIDGVAINGVSGGPVLYSTPSDGVQIVGSITAYIANRATGEALPGLSVAQDVSHLHNIVIHVKSIDEAKKKQAAESEKPVSIAADSADDASPPPATEPSGN